MRTLRPATLMLLLVACVLVPGRLAAQEETRKPVKLANGARLVPRQERQTHAKNCDAQREWFEVEGGVEAAARAINARVRKDITVGRKLKDSDCPGEDSDEDYTYSNYVSPTGAWRRFFGLRTFVAFPGGSGRYVIRCAAHDLETGKRHDLKSYLTPQGVKILTKRLNQNAGDIPGGYLPLKVKEAEACLDDRGIRVVWSTESGAVMEAEVLVTGSELASFFRLPTELQDDAPAAR